MCLTTFPLSSGLFLLKEETFLQLGQYTTPANYCSATPNQLHDPQRLQEDNRFYFFLLKC